MSGIIFVIAKAFQFLIELVVEVVCLALFIASLPAFWRWPALVDMECGKDRWSRRLFCAGNFAVVILDLLTCLPLGMTIGSWRVIALCEEIAHEFNKSEKFVNLGVRAVIWEQWARMFFMDIPCILGVVFTHVTFWRIPFFWIEIVKELGKSGNLLCGNWERHKSTEFRSIIAYNVINSVLDIFLMPFGFVLLISVYRIPVAYAKVQKLALDIHSSEKEKLLMQKFQVVVQCLLVFVDIPFGFMAIVAFFCVFRTEIMITQLRSTPLASHKNVGWERRAIIGLNFLFSVRDVFCIPLFFIVLGSIYRGFFAIKSILDNISKWGPVEASVTVTSATLELPEDTRGTGVILTVRGTKASQFVLPNGPLKLYIRNTSSFFNKVGMTFGSAADSIGRTMLPLDVTKYVDSSNIKTGATDCSFVINLGNSFKCKAIRKNALKLGCVAEMQVEFGSHDGTLVALSIDLLHFEQYIDSKFPRKLDVVDLSKYDAEERGGKPLSDVFWKIVLFQLVFLFIDIFAVLCFFLLHLFPHRVIRMYSSACAGQERMKALKQQEILKKLQGQVLVQEDYFPRAIESIDKQLRAHMTRIGTGKNTQQGDQYRWRQGRGRFGRGGRYVLDRHSEVLNPVTPALVVTILSYEEQLGGSRMKCVDIGETATSVFDQLTEAVQQYTLNYYLMLTLQMAEDGVSDGSLRTIFSFLPQARADAKTNDAQLASNGTLVLDASDEIPHAPVQRRNSQLAFREDTEDLMLQRAIEESLKPQQPVVQENSDVMPREPAHTPSNLDTQYSVAEHTGGNGGASLDTQLISEAGKQEQLRRSIPGSVDELLSKWRQEYKTTHIASMKKACDEIDAKVSKLPWFGGKEGWAGARNVIFKEVAQVGFDLLAVLCFLLVLCTGYRTIWILGEVISAKNRRKTACWGVAELCLDIVYLWKFCIVLIGIRGAVSLPADLLFYLAQRPSFSTARQVIDYHVQLVFLDLITVLTGVFAWDTLRFALATIVFGAFSPGVLFESAFSRWENHSDGSTSMGDKDICRAGWILLFSMTWMFGVPIFVGYYVSNHSAQNATIVFFSFLAACMVLGISVAIHLRDERTASIRRGIVRYLSPSFFNVSAALSLILETVWLLAIVLAVSREDIFGSAWGRGLENASNYAFLIFGESWTRRGIPFGVYFSIVTGVLYFIISATPIVCGDILHIKSSKRLIRSPVWTTLMQFFGQSIALLVARNLTAILICDEATNTMQLSFGQMECWADSTKGLAVFCMILLSYYVPSCLMRNMRYDESICRSLDVVYPQLFKILINASNLLAVCLCTILYQRRSAVCIVMMICMTWNVFWTIAYTTFFNKSEGACCSVKTFTLYRRASYMCVLLCSTVMLVRLNDNAGPSYWSLYASAGIIGLAILGCIGFSCINRYCSDASPDDDSVEELRELLLAIEEHLYLKQKGMYDSWRLKRRRWRSQVGSAMRSSPIVVLACELESNTMTFFLSKQFLVARKPWLEKAASIVSPADAHSQLDIDTNYEQAQWLYIIVCCSCCWNVCSHMDNGSSDDEEPQKEEHERLGIALEIVMSLRNSAIRKKNAIMVNTLPPPGEEI